MIKIELAKCCIACEHFRIEAEQLEKAADRAAVRDLGLEHVTAAMPLIVGCIHRRVCGKYLSEPIQALPAEELFGK